MLSTLLTLQTQCAEVDASGINIGDARSWREQLGCDPSYSTGSSDEAERVLTPSLLRQALVPTPLELACDQVDCRDRRRRFADEACAASRRACLSASSTLSSLLGDSRPGPEMPPASTSA